MQLQIVRLLAISILPAASLVFYTLSLTGCSADSPGLTNIFLVSLNSSKEAELRVGYFGMCLHHNSTRKCVSTPYSSSAKTLISLFSPETVQKSNKPLLSIHMLDIALQLQKNIFFCFEAFAGGLFFVTLLFFLTKVYFHIGKGVIPRWPLFQQKWPEKLLLVSIVMSAINVVAVTQTGNAVAFATTELHAAPITAKAGLTLQILEWLAFGFSALFYAVLTISIRQGRRQQDFGGGKFNDFPLPSPRAPRSPFGPPPHLGGPM